MNGNFWFIINITILAGFTAVIIFAFLALSRKYRKHRSKAYKQIAKEFGLTYDYPKEGFWTWYPIMKPKSLHKLQGEISGHHVEIYDEQQIPPIYGGFITKRRTVFKKDGEIDKKIANFISGYAPVSQIKDWLNTIN